MKNQATPTAIQLRTLSHRDQVLFAYKCSSLIKSKMAPDGLAALEVVERWLDGKATVRECSKAWARAEDGAREWAWAAAPTAPVDIAATTYAAEVAWAATSPEWAVTAAARVAEYTAQVDPSTMDTIQLFYHELMDPVGTLIESLGLDNLS